MWTFYVKSSRCLHCPLPIDAVLILMSCSVLGLLSLVYYSNSPAFSTITTIVSVKMGCAVAQHCCKGDQPFQWLTPPPITGISVAVAVAGRAE